MDAGGKLPGAVRAAAVAAVVVAGTITVSSAAASAPTVPCSAGGAGLVSAVKKADNGTGPKTITLAHGCTYTLTAPSDYWYGPDALPAITTTVVIEGNGAKIARTGTTPFRFFFVSANPLASSTPSYVSLGAGNLTLKDLTLTGGLAKGGNGGGLDGGGGGAGMGGAIFNQGRLTLQRVTISHNTAQGGDGGGAANGAGGGGIGTDALSTSPYGGGGMTSTDEFAGLPASTNGGGSAGGGGSGFAGEVGQNGGVSCGDCGGAGGGPETGLGGLGGGATVIDGSSLSGDGAGGGGGGSVNLAGDGGFGGGGGGSDSGGTPGHGGFGAGAGSVANSGSGGGGGGAGLGGGIFNEQGTVTVVNSTLAQNTATGGTPSNAATPGSGLGGGIFNLNGSVSVTNSTITANTVSGGSTPITPSNAGGIYNLGANAHTAVSSTVTLTNTILAHTPSGLPDLFDGIPSNVGYVNSSNTNNMATASTNASHADIIETTDPNDSNITGSPSKQDPKLGPLKFNGGPGMFTELPAVQSPAINRGVSSGAPATDERGFKRPQGRAVDIGAVEYEVPVALKPPRVSGTPKVGSKVTCVNATWQTREGPTHFRYGWRDNGTLIAGDTQSTLVLGSHEVGHKIACQVTASNVAGAKTVVSLPVTVAK